MNTFNEKLRLERIKRANLFARLRKTMTADEIAKAHKISASRVRQLLASVK